MSKAQQLTKQLNKQGIQAVTIETDEPTLEDDQVTIFQDERYMLHLQVGNGYTCLVLWDEVECSSEYLHEDNKLDEVFIAKIKEAITKHLVMN